MTFDLVLRGVHLKDLILLNTALGDKVEGELVNFRKMVQLSLTFTQLMQVATTTLPIEVNMDLVNTIRVSIFEVNMDLVSTMQVSSFEVNMDLVSTIQVSSFEVNMDLVNTVQVNSFEVNMGQYGPRQYDTGE